MYTLNIYGGLERPWKYVLSTVLSLIELHEIHNIWANNSIYTKSDSVLLKNIQQKMLLKHGMLHIPSGLNVHN